MSDNRHVSEKCISSNVVDMVMRVQDGFDMCATSCNLMYNACRHLWEGNGIDYHGTLSCDDKGGIRHTHLSLSMHNRHDSVRYFTHLLPRPGVHTLLTCSSDPIR